MVEVLSSAQNRCFVECASRLHLAEHAMSRAHVHARADRFADQQSALGVVASRGDVSQHQVHSTQSAAALGQRDAIAELGRKLDGLLEVFDRLDAATERALAFAHAREDVGLLVAASQTDHLLQGSLWALAILLDMGGPVVFGVEGWKLKPEHFAERHGLIMIIALGESIVAIGIGAEAGVGAGEVVAAVIGIALACALWWLYFDVVSLVAVRRLMRAAVGREQNALARDSYSIIHLPMVAGIVLLALGLKKTLEHVGDPLELEVATAMLGGIAIYLVAHAAFRYRNIGRLSWMRIIASGVLVAMIPIALEISATATAAAALAVLVILIAAEVSRQGEFRDRLRHEASVG